MRDWEEYKTSARSRGVLAFELFMVRTRPSSDRAALLENLDKHLAYQDKLEREGKLAFAGPLSDTSGRSMSGEGLIVYRAASMEEARALAEADPMHSSGAREFEIRKWLINEGHIEVTVGLSSQSVSLG